MCVIVDVRRRCLCDWMRRVFSDKKMKRSGQRKGPKKSLVRLKFLEKYCNELLSCDPRVTQSADLLQFFQPKDQDLEPEFAKNGYVFAVFAGPRTKQILEQVETLTCVTSCSAGIDPLKQISQVKVIL